jgi:ABC transporter DrrB family efflux protein
MSTVVQSAPDTPARSLKPLSRSAFYWALADAAVIAGRQLRQIPRVPDELITATIQPIIVVLMFKFIFGGALQTFVGVTYINYLMPGAFVFSAILASANTGIGVSTDLQRGLVERFRSLPMARSAVLTGRVTADILRNLIIILVTWAIGLLVGFRPTGTPLQWVEATVLVLFTSFVFSWLAALMGVLIPSPEAVAQAGIVWFLPFVLGSSAFVPVSTMPSWLQAFVNHQPVSLTMDAARGLLLGHPNASTIAETLIWLVALLIVLIPLTVWAYARRVGR